jgi:hypothetical protein
MPHVQTPERFLEYRPKTLSFWDRFGLEMTN